MARIRTVKPEFFRHEGLFEAERDSGLPLRVAFAGLWTASDKEGRFKWLPRMLKLDCLPFDDVDFSRVLDALWTRGFIERYAVGGKEYGFIPSWHEHQVINNREAKSQLPAPNENNTLTRDARVDDASTTSHGNDTGEGKGREGEGKGREKEVRATARGAAFAFQGSVVRLNVRDFDGWRKAYSNLDLLAELTARDAWLSSEQATDDDRKRWFVSTSKYLANRNMEAKTKTHQHEASDPYRGCII